MLQGCDKFMVNALGFIISLLSCFLLPQEALHLPFGVVPQKCRLHTITRLKNLKLLRKDSQARCPPVPTIQ